MPKEISTISGSVFVVDDEDAETALAYRWSVLFHPTGDVSCVYSKISGKEILLGLLDFVFPPPPATTTQADSPDDCAGGNLTTDAAWIDTQDCLPATARNRGEVGSSGDPYEGLIRAAYYL